MGLTGLATEAGFKFKHNFSKETDGPLVCPTDPPVALKRTWDDGDITAPLRSTARASAWAEAHARGGYVLRNAGYYQQHHGCDCTTDKCKQDYACILNKLQGKDHVGC